MSLRPALVFFSGAILHWKLENTFAKAGGKPLRTNSDSSSVIMFGAFCNHDGGVGMGRSFYICHRPECDATQFKNR